MSIIIRDGHMPSECEYCPLCRYYPENKRVWCNGVNRILKNVWENADWTHLGVKKPDWCPLVEIPKKARLIDAEALYMDIIHRFDYCDDFLEMLEDAPTIFEEGDE